MADATLDDLDQDGAFDEESVERCGDWFLTASCVYGDAGQGIFWELFQQASLLNEQLQEFDPETASFADYYHYCCQSMLKLLELFKKTVQQPISVSVFHKSSSMFLLTLAAALPETVIEDVLAPLLLDQRSLLEFKRSDLKAKSMVVSAGFQLFDVMHKRDMNTAQPRILMHGILTSLQRECGIVHEMMQGPLHPREDVDWHPSLFSTPSEHRAYLKMLETGDQLLVELILAHYQRCMCRYLSETEQLDSEEIMYWIESILPSVKTAENIPSSVKEASLDVVMTGLRVIERKMIGEELVSFVQPCMDSLLPTLDSYICWHLPQRNSQPLPANHIQIEKERRVLDAAVQLAGEIHGLSFVSGLHKWPLHEQYGTRPYPSHLFREKATVLHRSFLSLFVSSFLRVVINVVHPLSSSQCAFCLSCWFGQLLDVQSGLLVYYSTSILSHLPELQGAFEDTNWHEKLKNGPSNDAVWELTEAVLQRIALKEKSTVNTITHRLHQMWHAREEEINACGSLSKTQKMAYLQKSATLLSGLLQLKSPVTAVLPQTTTFGREHPATAFVLTAGNRPPQIALYFSWVAKSVIYLEEAYFAECSNVLQATGLSNPEDITTAIMGTPLTCLREMLVLFINEFSKSSMDQNSPFLRGLHFFVLSIMEMPVAIYGPNPVDLAIMDVFAVALNPTETQFFEEVSSTLSSSLSGGQSHSRIQFVHYLLRTFFWHYVEKAIHGNALAERAVVNGILFMKSLFVRSSIEPEMVFCTLLPAFLAPVCRIVKSESSKELSASCRIPVFSFLLELFEHYADWIPEPSANYNQLEITGSVLMRGGPLQTGSTIDREVARKALSILLSLLFRSILSMFRFLLPPQVLARADAMEHHAPAYFPITDLDAARAQGSFAVLFGQYRKPSWVENLTRSQILKAPSLVNIDHAEHVSESQAQLPEKALNFLKRFASLSTTALHWAMPILSPMKCLFHTNCPLIMLYHSEFTSFNNLIVSSGAPVTAMSMFDATASIPIKKEATEVERIKRELKEENPKV